MKSMALTAWAKSGNFITEMQHTPFEVTLDKQALDLLSPLGPVLHRAMEPGLELARGYFEEHPDYPHDPYLFSNLARYHTCLHLASASLPDGVTFTRLRNNGILIRCDGILVRVWKADEDGEMHGPGTSKRKRDYCTQDFLFPVDARDLRYAVLWDLDQSTGLLTFALACPKKFDIERPWASPECHFYINFPHAATEVTAAERFSQGAAHEDDIVLKPKRKIAEADDDASNS
jgi:hypothetical protein